MKLFTKEFFKTEKASQYNDGEGLSKGFTKGEWVIITTWMVKYQKTPIRSVQDEVGYRVLDESFPSISVIRNRP